MRGCLPRSSSRIGALGSSLLILYSSTRASTLPAASRSTRRKPCLPGSVIRTLAERLSSVPTGRVRARSSCSPSTWTQKESVPRSGALAVTDSPYMPAASSASNCTKKPSSVTTICLPSRSPSFIPSPNVGNCFALASTTVSRASMGVSVRLSRSTPENGPAASALRITVVHMLPSPCLSLPASMRLRNPSRIFTPRRSISLPSRLPGLSLGNAAGYAKAAGERSHRRHDTYFVCFQELS